MLVTLGLSFMIADVCLMVWTGDPIRIDTPPALRGATSVMGLGFPTYRLAISLVAVVFAAALWGLLDRTRLGAMIRAGVDDAPMARVVGIRVSRLFTVVFGLGAWLAGFAGVIGGPILSVYPGLDQEMLPLALVVVILGGSGSLVGSLVGSFVVGFLYNFGQAMFPELAYVVLFLPMLLVLVVRPQGLFGRAGGVRRLALAAALAVAATLPVLARLHLLRQHRQPDPLLRDLRARGERAGRLRRARLAGPRRPLRHRGLRGGQAADRRPWPRGRRRRRARASRWPPPPSSRCSRCAAPASASS